MSTSTRNAVLALLLFLLAWGPGLEVIQAFGPPHPTTDTAGPIDTDRLAVDGERESVGASSLVVTAQRRSVTAARVGVRAVRHPVQRVVVRFGFSCYEVPSNARHDLRRWVRRLPGTTTVEVVGHADVIDNDARNVKLSGWRADEVAELLRRREIELSDVDWRGKSRARAARDDAPGRRRDRRVVIVPTAPGEIRVTSPTTFIRAKPPTECPRPFDGSAR